MGRSVVRIPRPVRRRLRRVVQKAADSLHGRRAHAILLLRETGGNVSQVADLMCAARSSVNRWRGLFEEFGEDGLMPQARGRTDYKSSDKLLSALASLLETPPQTYRYLRSRWSSELLARKLAARTGVVVHATTIRRWLARLDYRWRRARPTLFKRDPRKSERMRAIQAALARNVRGTEVLYVDEVDIDLNPKLGPAWTRRGQQRAVPTPGKNEKRYIAGALHARTGRIHWCSGLSKRTDLFLSLLEQLRTSYRKARRIIVILDNYRIHKSRASRAWIQHNPKFKLLFQPVYHPWVNVIERVWRQLHETVTRNHRFASMSGLMEAVNAFLRCAQPFPGADYASAKL
jgi:transposase